MSRQQTASGQPCVYRSSAIFLNDSEGAAFGVDINGNLLVNVVAGGGGGGAVTQGTTPWVDNISQFGGNNVVTGTGISGVGIPRVTVSSDSFPATQAVTGTFFQTTQPVSLTSTTITGSVAVTGTFFQSTQPVSALNLPLPNNATQETGGNLATIVTNTTGLTVAQGSTTNGQKGELVQGAVTTNAPTYSTTQTSPLSLTTTGLLRVGGSPTASAVPANAFYIATQASGGNLTGLSSSSNIGDGGGDSSLATSGTVFNGTTWDRSRAYNGASAGSSTGVQASALVGGLMPIGTKLNTTANHLTTNATTTLTASTAYISSIAISNEVGGTTSSLTVQDKSGTPLKLVNGLATTALTTAPTIITFNTPVLMTSGIDIITAGAVAATVDVWINYYQ